MPDLSLHLRFVPRDTVYQARGVAVEMPIPTDVFGLLFVLVACAIVLAWSGRDSWRDEQGWHPWILIEDLGGYFLFMGMFVVSTMQIAIRYGLSDIITMPWTEEFARLVMVWLALWGAASVQRRDQHIAMTIVYDFVPEHLKRWMRLLGDVIMLAAMVPLVWYGWDTARSLDIMWTIALGVPLSTFAYPIPVGGALIIVHTLRLMILRWRNQPIPNNEAIVV